MVNKLVVGGAEQWVAGVRPQAGAVDQCLRVLNAETDGEGFGLHEHACGMQHGEGVSGAVPEREHDLARGNEFAIFQSDALHGAVFNGQIGDLAPETDLATQCFDFSAHALDHADQAEGADVRLGEVEDFLRRAGLNELGEHLAPEVARVFDLAVELAVGESTGATLPELHVRLWVELVFAPQLPGVLGAFAHGLAAFEDDRAKPHLREDQRGENAGRPETDDQWAESKCFRRAGHEMVGHVRRLGDARIVGKARQQCGFGVGASCHFKIDTVDEGERLLLARVMAALVHVQGDKGLFRQSEAFGGGGLERLLRVVERQAEFGDTDHAGVLCVWRCLSRSGAQALRTRRAVARRWRIWPVRGASRRRRAVPGCRWRRPASTVRTVPRPRRRGRRRA